MVWIEDGMLKIVTFNINKRLENLRAWLAQTEPDVVCLQELKADVIFHRDVLIASRPLEIVTLPACVGSRRLRIEGTDEIADSTATPRAQVRHFGTKARLKESKYGSVIEEIR
jgi:hypothetical protein